MKERPILFSTPMVQAILSGQKTQTRRVIKFELNQIHEKGVPKQLLGDWYLSNINSFKNGILSYDVQTDVDDYYTREIKCPYGQIGDQLWIRETWTEFVPQHVINGKHYVYKADMTPDGEEIRQEYIKCGYPYQWRPSIFMPRKASRLQLEITNIKVERIQDITPYDAFCEGVKVEEPKGANPDNQHFPEDFDKWDKKKQEGWFDSTARAVYMSQCWFADELNKTFKALWDSINSKRGYSWESNPWVWVIEFKRIDK